MLTTIDLPMETIMAIKEKGMTYRGVISLGLLNARAQLENNDILKDLRADNERLRAKIEKLVRTIDEVRKE